MTRAIAVGYASMDYPALLDGRFLPDQTVLIKQRAADEFPRPGGSPLYVARPWVTTGCNATLVTWVGDDELGRHFTNSTLEYGIAADGIAIVDDGATPVCFLIYQEDGSCGCCFDPGFLGRETLTPEQSAYLRDADLLCVTVGPPDIGADALALVADSATVAWVAKNDPVSYPESFRLALGARADYVFCNRREREWIDQALLNRSKAAPLIVETDGADPVKVERGGEVHYLDVTELEVHDPTGAGDTLAGGCLAAVLAGETEPQRIAQAGIDASAAMLRRRLGKGLDS
ncbi:MAG: carbohydrate kinase family protein [Pseudomonadota bacterium]